MNLQPFDPGLHYSSADDLHLQQDLHIQQDWQGSTHEFDPQAIGLESQMAEPIQVNPYEPLSGNNFGDVHHDLGCHQHSHTDSLIDEAGYGSGGGYSDSYSFQESLQQNLQQQDNPFDFHQGADTHSPLVSSYDSGHQEHSVMPRSVADSGSEALEKANEQERLANENLQKSKDASKTADYFRDRHDTSTAASYDRTARETMEASEKYQQEAQKLRDQAYKF